MCSMRKHSALLRKDLSPLVLLSEELLGPVSRGCQGTAACACTYVSTYTSMICEALKQGVQPMGHTQPRAAVSAAQHTIMDSLSYFT